MLRAGRQRVDVAYVVINQKARAFWARITSSDDIIHVTRHTDEHLCVWELTQSNGSLAPAIQCHFIACTAATMSCRASQVIRKSKEKKEKKIDSSLIKRVIMSVVSVGSCAFPQCISAVHGGLLQFPLGPYSGVFDNSHTLPLPCPIVCLG